MLRLPSNLAGGGQNGSWGDGGAIYTTAGSLTLSSNSFTSNRAGGDTAGYGGAVYADQAFSGTGNTFAQNSAFGNGANGVSYLEVPILRGFGIATHRDSVHLELQSASGLPCKAGSALGGAIDSEGNATLASLTLTGNVATGGLGGAAEGGAIYRRRAVARSTLTSLTATGNSASATGANSYAAGGAIATFAALSIAGSSSLASNVASVGDERCDQRFQGGAVAVEVGPFSFTGTATKNTATTQGGAFWIDDTAVIANALVSSNKVTAVQQPNDGGGGVYVALGGALTLTGSTLTANSTLGNVPFTGGGGLFNNANPGPVSLVNDTIAANTSSADGGGVENDSQAGFTLTNVTVYQNTATGHGGSLKNLDTDSAMTAANSIFAGGIGRRCSRRRFKRPGSVVSNDYNLVQQTPTGNALTGTTTHNLVGTNPGLSTLANNGGPTPTNADAPGGPGTAYIPISVCVAAKVTVDQRQLPRNAKHTGTCDVGAYENQNP